MPKSTPGTTEFRQRLGSHIIAARERAGLKGIQLAAALEVTPSTVSDWESGRRQPSLEHLVMIARVTKESVAFLLSDSLATKGSLETTGRELVRKLGGRRAQFMLAMPERRLLRDIDLMIGVAASDGVIEAERLTPSAPPHKA
jgi:transcriptional regulator with XRE-family HTH domain